MYTPNCERGIRFDDPALGLKWPMAPTVMSDKDKNWPVFDAKLAEVARESVQGRVPANTFAWQRDFHECVECRRVFWQGTHWRRIADKLSAISFQPSAKRQ